MCPTTPTRSDALRNRTRVLDAALAVFAAEGVAASTETIAARAGVGVATVFRHFPTKAELLAAVLDHMFEELERMTTDALAAPDPGSAFFALVTRLVDQAATKRAVAEALGETAHAIKRRGHGDGFRVAMAKLLARAQEAGTVRRDVGRDEIVAVIAAASRAAEHAGSNARLRKRSVAIVLDGLRPAHASRR
jgi:AcrR family transcriptional regulator